MPISVRGIVVTSFKEPTFVLTRISHALDTLICSKKRSIQPLGRLDGFETCDAIIATTSYGTSIVRFAYEGEKRQMWVHFRCDCDAPEYGPKKLILSMNAFGQYELYLKTALRSLASLGALYYDATECGDHKTPEQLPYPGSTYLMDCAAGTERPCPTSLRMWLDAGEFYPPEIAPPIGISPERSHQILGMRYAAAVAAIQQDMDALTLSLEPA